MKIKRLLLLLICLLVSFTGQANEVKITKVNLDVRYQAFESYMSDNLQEAKALYSQCLTLGNEDISCLLGRAGINLLEQNYVPALADYEQVVFLDKNNSWALAGITTIFSKTGTELIDLSSLESLAKSEVSYSGLYQVLGEWFLQEKILFKAESYFQNAIKLDSSNPYLRSSLGLVYELNNQLDKSLKEYRASLTLSSNKPGFPVELIAHKINTLDKSQLNERSSR